MIMDKLLLFSSAQAVAADTASTDVVDLNNARDMGIGWPLRVMILVTTSFLTTDAGTLQFLLQGSTDNSTYTTYAQSPAIAAATLTAGRRALDVDWPRPGPGMALPRYIRIYYDVTNSFTAGAVTATLVLDRQDFVAYPPGVVITT